MQLTRREFLTASGAAVSLTVAKMVTGPIVPIFSDSAHAEGPQPDPEWTPLKSLADQADHKNFLDDLGFGAKLDNTFLVAGSTAFDNILDHVRSRFSNAKTPRNKDGHCTDTARWFLEDFLQLALTDGRILDSMEVSWQDLLDKGGRPSGKRALRIVTKTDGTTTNGSPFKRVISYIHEEPINGKWGTTYVDDGKNSLRQKGRLLEGREKRSAVEVMAKKLKADSTNSAPLPCATPESQKARVPETAPLPLPNPGKATKKIEPAVILGGTTLALAGLIFLRERGMRTT